MSDTENMEYTNKLFDEKFDKIKFVHFDTSTECDNFIKYIGEKQIYISHKCCLGIGCGIENIKNKELKTIMDEYKQKNNIIY